ncbi:hypothetical protein COY93_03495 [Candidatus Uhrbacteria bacterium CG_4_10_14_0_8_um_filter_58_22]|uniref:Uncharacterized protein n=1 Tax=Candidatus Uhrbacteria bacterium CG_4_10_14_0_8_um_filter_58_22 TaxID=1975029 RepID=A0A2M7Q9E0_9BACT|nr:MAG: hypothetical protein AUJ19_02815 [Parcubacteria group bacterium CG1_02_58_44]PIY62299.1 MAG: hypothetical protein COY93_03495 [Candidatus Uhrbacteria bacterium CG_4_10_14_0_8_um_filter_58_22]
MTDTAAVAAFEPESLIHGLYTPAGEIRRVFGKWLAEQGFRADRFSWDSEEERLLPVSMDDPEIAGVLDLTLGTPEQTFEFA